MHVELSSHAQRMLRERGIPEDIIRDIVARPQRVAGVGSQKMVAQKRIRWRDQEILCRVVYVPQGEIARVVTAYVTTKFTKYE